jgi:DNA polymerase kappa
VGLIEAVVAEARQRIKETCRVTASAGMGPSFPLAKISADMRKPDGQFRVPSRRDEVLAFLRDLPVRKVGHLSGSASPCLPAP